MNKQYLWYEFVKKILTAYSNESTKPQDVYIREKLKNVVINNEFEGVTRLAEFKFVTILILK